MPIERGTTVVTMSYYSYSYYYYYYYYHISIFWREIQTFESEKFRIFGGKEDGNLGKPSYKVG